MADFWLTFGICLVVAYLIFAGFLAVFLLVIGDIKLREWFKGWEAAMVCKEVFDNEKEPNIPDTDCFEEWD